jgi:hypothetical protein
LGVFPNSASLRQALLLLHAFALPQKASYQFQAQIASAY